jgi:hypothetical protein
MDYQKQGTDFLNRHGLEFRAVHIGHDCPPFCEHAEHGLRMDEVDKWPRQSHIHGHHYHITISAKDRGHFTIDYWNSYADEFHNWAIGKQHRTWEIPFKVMDMIKAERAKSLAREEPTPYDVLCCITKSDPILAVRSLSTTRYRKNGQKPADSLSPKN